GVVPQWGGGGNHNQAADMD
nr:type 3 fimbriae {N-terminal} [Salmonella typhimurium, var. copenhagen STMVC Moe 8, Peptide Partial, 19 aa] [Salmonella enterica subsp. enterica serovar Typhimurium]